MKKQTEETIIKHQVRDYLRLKGWFVFHNLAGLGVHPGISDFTAIRYGQVIFIEIKTDKGIQSDNQKKFQEQVKSHGGLYYIVRSIDDLISWGLSI
jgi:hypothetical protein